LHFLIQGGVRNGTVAQENTAGQGSRPVGFSTGAGADDHAEVALAVREVVASNITMSVGHINIGF